MDSLKQPQTAAVNYGLPQTTANSAKLSQAAASYSQTAAEPPGPLPGSRKLRRGASVNRLSNSMIIFARTKLQKAANNLPKYYELSLKMLIL